jgi:hypothetical protein
MKPRHAAVFTLVDRYLVVQRKTRRDLRQPVPLLGGRLEKTDWLSVRNCQARLF